VTSDDQVKAYIKKIISQLNKWMVGQKISKLVIVFTGKETGDNLERWQFDVNLTKPPAAGNSSKSAASGSGDKENAAGGASEHSGAALSDDETQAAIRALFRQITACVTFLPELAEPCTFNVLVYADADSDVPIDWGDSDAREIDGGEKVLLRSFSTTNHRVDTMVSYRVGD
jgi:mitotic spindle assembly checkpoint protein MAD2